MNCLVNNTPQFQHNSHKIIKSKMKINHNLLKVNLSMQSKTLKWNCNTYSIDVCYSYMQQMELFQVRNNLHQPAHIERIKDIFPDIHITNPEQQNPRSSS